MNPYESPKTEQLPQVNRELWPVVVTSAGYGMVGLSLLTKQAITFGVLELWALCFVVLFALFVVGLHRAK